MTAAAQITNPAQESSRAGVYVRGLALMVHYRTPLDDEGADMLRWVVSSYGFVVTALRKSMAQEWVSFSDFANLIEGAYFKGEPKTERVVSFLRRLDVSEACFPPLTTEERTRIFKTVYAATHSDFKGDDSLMSWAGYGSGLVTVETISDMELIARLRHLMRKN